MMKKISIFINVITVSLIGLAIYKLSTGSQMIQVAKDLPAYNVSQDLTQNEFPTLVRLSKDGQFFCSGSVISDDYVLTAAHCLVDENGEMLDTEFNIESIDQVNKVVVTAAGVNQRADYGLVKGDFKRYTKMTINMDPGTGIGDSIYIACGFPWGSSDICYPLGSQFQTYYDGFATTGRLYAGMSGGPVVDINRMTIIAVNSAVAEGYVIVMPTVGLFETLGIKVIKWVIQLF